MAYKTKDPNTETSRDSVAWRVVNFRTILVCVVIKTYIGMCRVQAIYCSLHAEPVAAANNVSLLSEVIESICSDGGFLIPSSEAAGAARCAKTLFHWIKDNQQSETYLKFCNNLAKVLMESLPSTFKLSKRERAKLWSKLFQLQMSPKFIKLWEDFIPHM